MKASSTRKAYLDEQKKRGREKNRARKFHEHPQARHPAVPVEKAP